MISGDPEASINMVSRSKDDEVIVPIPSQLNQIDEARKDFLKNGVPLYQAAMEGDWETAHNIFKKAPNWISASITKRDDTTLHIATAAKHLDFVQNLADLMISINDYLESKNIHKNTAFCFAASSGIVDIAKLMVERNKDLPDIRGNENMTPLHMAILLGKREMVKYLIKVTSDRLLNDKDRIGMITSAIEAGLYDVALHFLDKHPHLAIERNSKKETVLHTLAAQRPLQIKTSEQSVWKKFLRRCTNKDETKHQMASAIQLTQRAWDEVIKLSESEISDLIAEPWLLLFVAAKMGNVDFLITLIRSYPDVIWKVDEKCRSIFHIAVIYRHEKIFKLIHEIGTIKEFIATYKDDDQNNMLHLAAKIAPRDRLNCVSGAALQMQRELLWFEAVKEVVQPHYAVAKNKVRKIVQDGEDGHEPGKTPQDEGGRSESESDFEDDDDDDDDDTSEFKRTPQTIFTDEHEKLQSLGEQWMKKTAESCTLVATLITTVNFTAAFTLPGGNDDKDGHPILLNEAYFKVFAISNAVSLFASSTSILMFLSILTSRYAERDFLKVLPYKLMVGLTSLFISIATMMVAFTATFFITFQRDSIWIPAPIAFLAVIPVLLFAFQQFPLLWDVYRSTYISSTLFQPSSQRTLSWKNNRPKGKMS